MNVVCPNCQQALPKVPKRKTSCPFCKKSILVRTANVISPGLSLLSEPDANAADLMKAVGATRDEFVRTRESLDRKFGRQSSAGDVAWSIVHERISRAHEFQERKAFYWLAAGYLVAEGKDWLQVHRQAHRMDLLNWKQDVKAGLLSASRTRVVVLATPDSCEACQTIASRSFSIDEALAQDPLPVVACTRDKGDRARGWCRCSYALKC